MVIVGGEGAGQAYEGDIVGKIPLGPLYDHADDEVVLCLQLFFFPVVHDLHDEAWAGSCKGKE